MSVGSVSSCRQHRVQNSGLGAQVQGEAWFVHCRFEAPGRSCGWRCPPGGGRYGHSSGLVCTRWGSGSHRESVWVGGEDLGGGRWVIVQLTKAENDHDSVFWGSPHDVPLAVTPLTSPPRIHLEASLLAFCAEGAKLPQAPTCLPFSPSPRSLPEDLLWTPSS